MSTAADQTNSEQENIHRNGQLCSRPTDQGSAELEITGGEMAQDSVQNSGKLMSLIVLLLK